MILVTGGTGLVGGHLLYVLSQTTDVKIVATYRTASKIEIVKRLFLSYTTDINPYFSKIEWVKADITELPALETIFNSYTISSVYHCAALVSFNPKDYSAMYQTNIIGTANLVNFSLAFNITKFCFVSSIATLDDAVKGKLITEETERNETTDRSDYAITKYGAEMEVWRASQEGLPVIVVNPGVILGKGFKSESSKIVFQIKDGFKFYTEGVTGFVGVEDVVRIMIQLMQSTIKNERFILVAENKSFKDLFFKMADEYSVTRPHIKVSKWFTEFLWRIDGLITLLTGKKRLMTKSMAQSCHNKQYFSSKKVQEKLNYTFEPIDCVIKRL